MAVYNLEDDVSSGKPKGILHILINSIQLTNIEWGLV